MLASLWKPPFETFIFKSVRKTLFEDFKSIREALRFTFQCQINYSKTNKKLIWKIVCKRSKLFFQVFTSSLSATIFRFSNSFKQGHTNEE